MGTIGRRLDRLATRYRPMTAEPRVFWIAVIGPDLDRALVDASLAAMRAAVSDDLAPLATRGEILASADLFDARSGHVEAVGHWWRLALEDGPVGVAATVTARGMRPWLAGV